jgi:hypothetical protein
MDRMAAKVPSPLAILPTAIPFPTAYLAEPIAIQAILVDQGAVSAIPTGVPKATEARVAIRIVWNRLCAALR